MITRITYDEVALGGFALAFGGIVVAGLFRWAESRAALEHTAVDEAELEALLDAAEASLNPRAAIEAYQTLAAQPLRQHGAVFTLLNGLALASVPIGVVIFAIGLLAR